MISTAFRRRGGAGAAVIAAALSLGAVAPVAAGPALDRIVGEKVLRLGYRTDAAPFAYVADNKANGFTINLCVEVAREIGRHLEIEGFTGDLVEVDTTDRFEALERGDIDILCGATTATLSRRERVDFSLPIFSTGVGVAMRRDAPELLREVLMENSPAAASRAAVKQALKGTTLGVRAATTAAAWLGAGPLKNIDGVKMVEIADHADGIEQLTTGQIDAYFADRAILAVQVGKSGVESAVQVSTKTFTHEPYALALPRGDSELRLEIDRALSQIYRTGAILRIYDRHLGRPTQDAAAFYAVTTLPE